VTRDGSRATTPQLGARYDLVPALRRDQQKSRITFKDYTLLSHNNDSSLLHLRGLHILSIHSSGDSSKTLWAT
jgi:hypothetical protein